MVYTFYRKRCAEGLLGYPDLDQSFKIKDKVNRVDEQKGINEYFSGHGCLAGAKYVATALHKIKSIVLVR